MSESKEASVPSVAPPCACDGLFDEASLEVNLKDSPSSEQIGLMEDGESELFLLLEHLVGISRRRSRQLWDERFTELASNFLDCALH